MASAKKNIPEQDLNEVVRRDIKRGLRALLVIVPVIVLLWVLYLLFFGWDPRQEHKTVEQTISAYTELVRPYLGPTGARPNPVVVDEFRSFFDSESRQFFKEHADAMAKRRFQFEPAKFEALSSRERQVEAMLLLTNRPPLNGMAGILEKRILDDGRTEVLVATTGRQPRVVTFRPSGDTWVMENLGGLRSELQAEFQQTGTE